MAKNSMFKLNLNILLEDGLQSGHNVIVNRDVKVREESAWTSNNHNDVMCEKQESDNGPKTILLGSQTNYHRQ